MGDIQLWTVAFLLVASQGIFLGYLMVIGKNLPQPRSVFLGLFIFASALILLFWTGFWNDLHRLYPVFELLFNPLPFVLGPLLLFYIDSFRSPLPRRQWVHLFPFLLCSTDSWISHCFSDYLAFFHLDTDHKTLLIYGLQSVSFLFYSYLSFAKWKRIPFQSKDRWNKRLSKFLLQFFTAFSLLALANFTLNRLLHIPIFLDVTLGLAICVLVYLTGYASFNVPRQMIAVQSPSRKYGNSSLKKAQVPALLQKILEHLEVQKSYLMPNYRLEDLSNETEIPVHHISELLNQYRRQGFSELINSYRVEEAKKLLTSEHYQHLKASAICYEAGFNSKTTYYHWFNKIVQCSPAQYRKRMKEV